ncbi:MAG: NAD(+) diphosphatase [Hyphomicrobiaceae bacterium]
MPTIGPMRTLDRMSPRRADDAWIEARRLAPGTRYLITVEHKPCILAAEPGTRTGLRFFSHAEIAAFGLERHPAIFLGLEGGERAHFALDITEHRARAVPGGPFILKPFVDLRSLAVQGALSPEELSLAGEARALAEWHNTHRCCGHCGSTTDIKDAGWRRKCWSCGRDHFPRTDPVVIMLVTYGNKCLLGHEERFHPKMFSTLAGFLEPGEDIEHAVGREVKEEVGLDIGRVIYQESQPWPFPHSLMIGCRAEALHDRVVVDPNELTSARWFDRGEIRAMDEGRHPEELIIPGRHAIARKLILAWLDDGAAG